MERRPSSKASKNNTMQDIDVRPLANDHHPSVSLAMRAQGRPCWRRCHPPRQVASIVRSSSNSSSRDRNTAWRCIISEKAASSSSRLGRQCTATMRTSSTLFLGPHARSQAWAIREWRAKGEMVKRRARVSPTIDHSSPILPESRRFSQRFRTRVPARGEFACTVGPRSSVPQDLESSLATRERMRAFYVHGTPHTAWHE